MDRYVEIGTPTDAIGGRSDINFRDPTHSSDRDRAVRRYASLTKGQNYSSLTTTALTYLLGLDNVRNYDGSWTEWGNLVGAAVEKP